MSDITRPSTEELLEHREWVERLARQLVRDPNLAADVSQQALLIALRQRAPVRSLRGWLGKVVWNLVRETGRSEARRVARERQSAAPIELPSTLDVVDRATSHHAVVEAVLCLKEPYRSVLLKRFYDGWPPRRIAAELGDQVTTVDSRIQRGLALLRKELDRFHGRDRAAWLRGVALLAGPVGPAEVIGVSSATVAAGASAAALGGVLAWSAWSVAAEERPAPPPRAESVVVDATSGDDELEPEPESLPPTESAGPVPFADEATVDPGALMDVVTEDEPVVTTDDDVASGADVTGSRSIVELDRRDSRELGELFAEYFAARRDVSTKRMMKAFERLKKSMSRAARSSGVETLLAYPALLREPIATPFVPKPNRNPGTLHLERFERKLISGVFEGTCFVRWPKLKKHARVPALVALPPLGLASHEVEQWAKRTYPAHEHRDVLLIVPFGEGAAAWESEAGLMRQFFSLAERLGDSPIDRTRIFLDGDRSVAASVAHVICEYPGFFAGAVLRAPGLLDARPNAVNAEHTAFPDVVEPAPHELSAFLRETRKVLAPSRVRFTTRSKPSNSAYWLQLTDFEATEAAPITVTVEVDRDANQVVVTAPLAVRAYSIYLNDELVDMDRPLRILHRGEETLAGSERVVFTGKKPRSFKKTLAIWYDNRSGNAGEVYVNVVEVTL